MLSYNTIKRLCKPLVLRRAKRMVDMGDHISRRTCRFEENETILRARVDASSSWDAAHRTSVVIDEDADAVTYFECDCRPTHAEDSPCDHVAALLLDFFDSPQHFEGYDARSRLYTSRGVMRLMEQGLPVPATTPSEAPTELEAATVWLEATLSYEVGFSVRFRLVGSKGAYALKSISEFVEKVEDRSFVAYGKRLAFEHAPRSFTPAARKTVDFLVRAVQNRRAFALDRLTSRVPQRASSAMPQRELHLSAPELWDLLALYESSGLLFEDRSAASFNSEVPHAMRIVHDDPQINMAITSVDDEGFELLRTSEVRLVSAGGRALAWDADTLYCCSEHLGKHVELLSAVLASPDERMVVTNEDAPLFCASVLSRLETCATIAIPQRLEAMRPQACVLRFYLDYDARRGLVTCDAQASYGDIAFPLMATRQLDTDSGMANVVRDIAAEARGREVVRRYFTVREGRVFSQAKGEDLGALVYEGVAALQEVGEVFAYPAFERLRNKARPRVRVGLSVRSRLLELDMRLEDLPQEELAGLLQSYMQKKTYHQLTDGTVVRVADADLAEAAKLAEELELSTKQLGEVQVIPAYKAFVMDSLVSDDEADESFAAYVNRVRGLDVSAYEVPASLEQTLRPYQQEGFRWLCGLCDMDLAGILADEMGLGKSIQFIAFVVAHAKQVRSHGPVLVVCPSSLVYNWEAEFAKFGPELVVRVVAGTPQERDQIRQTAGTDVLITSYDLLRRDVGEYEGMRLWCVALDEAQYIKNPTTQAARAVKQLAPQNRVALTGTPVENRLSELWSIFDFLMPGLLGSYERFRERFERPIVEDESSDAAIRLREALRPFILRRTKLSVAADLPDKIEQVVRTHMGHEQRRLYDAQVQEVRSRVQEGDAFGEGKFQILALLTRLRQICCDPALLYDAYDAGSCKTDAVLTLVERANDAGEKVLVFSQFTSYLAQISAALDARGIAHYQIDGSTPSAKRLELVDAFNADDTPVFLISLKAGGTGLNLTGATVVVHADPWWNVAAQNQATDRAHRIGQTREVTVYKVIAAHTIEERILELQRSKAELADAVVQGDVSSVSLASLTPEDLEDLLG